MAKQAPLVTRDLFTGDHRPLRLKSGDGSHIVLKQDGKGPQAPAPGMMYFPATARGKGKYCRDCGHCESIKIPGKRGRPGKVVDDGCRAVLDATGDYSRIHNIGQQSACKYFQPRQQ